MDKNRQKRVFYLVRSTFGRWKLKSDQSGPEQVKVVQSRRKWDKWAKIGKVGQSAPKWAKVGKVGQSGPKWAF